MCWACYCTGLLCNGIGCITLRAAQHVLGMFCTAALHRRVVQACRIGLRLKGPAHLLRPAHIPLPNSLFLQGHGRHCRRNRPSAGGPAWPRAGQAAACRCGAWHACHRHQRPGRGGCADGLPRHALHLPGKSGGGALGCCCCCCWVGLRHMLLGWLPSSVLGLVPQTVGLCTPALSCLSSPLTPPPTALPIQWCSATWCSG